MVGGACISAWGEKLEKKQFATGGRGSSKIEKGIVGRTKKETTQ